MIFIRPDLRDKSAKKHRINIEDRANFSTDYKGILGQLLDLTNPDDEGYPVVKALFVPKLKYWPTVRSLEFLGEQVPGGFDDIPPVLVLEDLIQALKEKANVFDPAIGE